jgi:hypothetical protein
MLVVGVDDPNRHDTHVHTIDMWFSRRRRVWVVERLNACGHVIGPSHYCTSEQDATHCLQEWLRAHGETHLVTPRDATASGQKKAAPHPRRHAA